MKNRLKPGEIIERIAKSEKVSEHEVRSQIMLAIRIGMLSQDPDVKNRWNEIPRKGEIPTPKELIAHLVSHTGLF